VHAPLEVDHSIRRVPKGRLATIAEIRWRIAKAHEVGMTCAPTTGICAWIAANADEEARDTDKKSITSYWLTLEARGEINANYTGGAEGVAKLLESKGHQIEKQERVGL